MCECPSVHLFEVEYKLDGMTVVPTCKKCGNGLNEKQADKFQKELVKSWGCLLYTSPSPRDQRGSRMPSSA